ncbi:MAG: DUF6664 family protein [Bacilli bacterium]
MQDGRTILEILSDNLCEITGQIREDIKSQNKTYKDIVDRINFILKCYPKIERIEFTNTAQTFEVKELKALHELTILMDSKREYEEQEYYFKGVRDSLLFLIPLLEIDIKKIEEIVKCQ